jgi:alkylation response protein AidB-like acyl-CoA dehydrogenase
MTRPTLRRSDFSLSDEQQAVRQVFAEFFTKECPTARVRDAEPIGFDGDLWKQFVALGGTTMALPEAVGGDGAGLVELALVAEEYGRHLAPVPLIESTVAGRVVARTDAATDHLVDVASGDRILTLALHRASGGPQLMPAGAVCDAAVGLDGTSLVLAPARTERPAVANQASAPLAWWDLAGERAGAVELASGKRAAALHADAVAEWKLLTAAALVGLSSAVLDLASDHARTRCAFGVPIGSFQGVSHRLADVLIGVEGARRLVWKAAWFADHEPGEAPRLLVSAWIQACDVATRAVAICLHVHGGVGFTMESDVQLFFRRAKGWIALAGDPRRDLLSLAELAAPMYEIAG